MDRGAVRRLRAFFDLSGFNALGAGLYSFGLSVYDGFDLLQVRQKPSFSDPRHSLSYSALTLSHTSSAYASARYRFFTANKAFSCHSKPFLL